MAEEDGNGDSHNIVQLAGVQLNSAATSTPTAQQVQHQQQQVQQPPQQMVLNGVAVHPTVVTATLTTADIFGDSLDTRRDLNVAASNGDHQGGLFQQVPHAPQNVYSPGVLLSAGNPQSIIQNNSHGKSVCRDFLRNVCFRGAQCKFAHPGDSVHGDFVFCHDFQNLGCNRFDCKFVHASKEDERRYLESGKLPSTAVNVTPAEANHEPICKDFLKRQCHRGRRCKFRHELSSGASGDKGGSLAARDGTVAIYYDSNRLFQLDGDCGYPSGAAATNPLLLLRGGERPGVERDRWSPLTTRVPLGSLVAPGHSQVAKRRRSSQGPLPNFDEEPLMASVGNLERENQMLRERLEDMQKQVKDLMSTNEFLLQQNAELRLSKHQAQAQAARACSGMSGHAGAAVMSTAGAVISNNVQQQLAAAASNVIPSSVLTSSVLQSVQSAANSLPAGVGAVGPVGAVGAVGGCALPSGVLSSMPNLSNALPGLASNLPNAVLGAPAGPITSEATVGLVPVSSIITMSSSSSNEQLVGGYPIVTTQGQLRYNPTRQ